MKLRFAVWQELIHVKSAAFGFVSRESLAGSGIKLRISISVTKREALIALCMILNFRHSRLARAVCAAIEGLVGFDTVTNDFAPTVVAHGSKLVNRAFKAIERMFCVSCDDFKRQVIIVAAYFTLCHIASP
jgi:hypothetical protein